jgi:hypothetical protein
MTEMYTRVIHKDAWSTLHAKNLDARKGIPAAIKNHGALDDWEKLRSPPSGRLEDELRLSLLLGAANYDEPLTRTCLRRALAVVAAGHEDPRWDTTWSNTRLVDYAKFQGMGLKVRAWIEDSELERTGLKESGEELCAGALENRPTWSELAQAEYLHGIQLILLSGDVNRALKKLALRNTFARVQSYHAWFASLVRLLHTSGNQDQPLHDHFDPFFDRIRDPSFQPVPNDADGNSLPGVAVLRLRLALIRWIYIERKPIAGNWRHIIGQIGY